MKRREFIVGLGAAAWPLTARAQQTGVPVIGFLHSASSGPYARFVAAFQQGLGETGYIEGRNLTIEYGWADDQYDHLQAMAADLVRRQVRAIAANGLAAGVAKEATATIPIIFAMAGDPVAAGFVASLNQPGGNLTGATTLGVEVQSKRLELLHELLPTATTMALLDAERPGGTEAVLTNLQAAARTLGLQLHVFTVRSKSDLDSVFTTLLRLQAGGLVIAGGAFSTARSEQLAALTLRYAVPAIFQFREFTAAGGLMSYGGSNLDAYRLAGVYTGRILKGERPSDLPVQQTTKLELIINLKTARALGLTVPLPLLARADEVIE
jgi:putative ABC transport system substrate-binding protein